MIVFCILFVERSRRDILQITVYFDIIFLMNFIADFAVLYITGVITKKKIRLGKLIIGAAFAAPVSIFISPLCHVRRINSFRSEKQE